MNRIYPCLDLCVTWATTGEVVLRRNDIRKGLCILDLQCLISVHLQISVPQSAQIIQRDRVIASLTQFEEVAEDATVAVAIAVRAPRRPPRREARQIFEAIDSNNPWELADLLAHALGCNGEFKKRRRALTDFVNYLLEAQQKVMVSGRRREPLLLRLLLASSASLSFLDAYGKTLLRAVHCHAGSDEERIMRAVVKTASKLKRAWETSLGTFTSPSTNSLSVHASKMH